MSSPFHNQNVLVMGLGHFGGGTGAALWLAAQGARVTVTDSAPADQLADSIQTLETASPGSFTYKLGGHDLSDFLHADLLVINPAVDRSQSPFVQAALNAGIPATTELNLFLQRCPARAIGITGSVGKSTTTALIYEALKAALHQPPEESPISNLQSQVSNLKSQISNSEDQPSSLETRNSKLETPRAFLGGNIGRSLLFDLPLIRPQDLVVLELSSFMLEEVRSEVRSSRFSVPPVSSSGADALVGRPSATPAPPGWSPHIALITNLFPNHLDRHGTLEAYAAAKQNILRFQSPSDFALLNQDHPLVSQWHSLTKAQVATFTTRNLPPLDLTIPGTHNQSNARAARAVLDCLAPHLPLDRAAALHAIRNFPGLPHRLQCVHTWEISPDPIPHPVARTTASAERLGATAERSPGSAGLPAATPECPRAPRQIRFYNDSKATTPDASLTAVQAFDPQTAIFIVGGYDKHLPPQAFSALESLLAHTALAILGIGQTGPAILARIQSLLPSTPPLHPRIHNAETLENAVSISKKWALELPARAIVLSPASASWDQFPNYECRGNLFATLSAQP